ncbi:hypothetical protein AO382_0480 [Moraxella catarrhalis]|uniref:Uncharacterized protein n=1 Tax=Moraxella catarrhalis TaxID=480 RepID=A0A7Z0V0G9_MORCA|nr:hypothetical protein AO382_0480 [Moraxella catarrhalis]
MLSNHQFFPNCINLQIFVWHQNDFAVKLQFFILITGNYFAISFADRF